MCQAEGSEPTLFHFSFCREHDQQLLTPSSISGRNNSCAFPLYSHFQQNTWSSTQEKIPAQGSIGCLHLHNSVFPSPIMDILAMFDFQKRHLNILMDEGSQMNMITEFQLSPSSGKLKVLGVKKKHFTLFIVNNFFFCNECLYSSYTLICI